MLVPRHTELSATVMEFCRFLRNKEFAIGFQEQKDALNSIIALKAIEDPDLFKSCLKATLVKSRKQQLQFDKYYAEFWKEIYQAVDSKVKVESDIKEKSNKPNGSKKPPSLLELKSWLFGSKTEGEIELASYSPAETEGQKDFSNIPRKGLEEMIGLLHAIAKIMATKNNRRYKYSRTPGMFDLRKTIRQNIRQGGEVINLAFKRHKPGRKKIVLLCDISRSMDLYSRFLIQFMYSFHQVHRSLETFVFSTFLQRVTPGLQKDSFEDVLDGLGNDISQWSGGTRIGDSLNTFVEEYALKFLDQKTVVVILSDGMDTGNIQTLKTSMEIIHRNSAFVIWLNPLAGNTNFRPEVAGMKAVLPFIDIFAGVFDVESLRKLLLGTIKAKGLRNRISHQYNLP